MKRIEVRELEYFLAVAGTLHFARAAEQLGIEPPPLSRAIAQLERRLGVSLFERTSRRVELTAAGRVFKAEARTTLRSLDRAVRRVRQVGRGALRIATPPGTGSGLLREMVRGYVALFGRDTIELVFATDQTVAVRDGRADIALVCSTEDLTGLDVQNVTTEHPVALVPADHPFATRETLTPACLLRDPAYATELPPLGLDALVDLVATGQLIAVVGDSAVDRLGRHVAAVPVTGLSPTDVLLAWPADSHDPRIASLLELAGQLAIQDPQRVQTTTTRRPRV
ncbi:LysR family transcriptional regulator [Amycolatopsis pigmentata]|uniref:LysR family transcriptional regulator n=1 Tax=Amycolatopsis pigmentata TaxID=450801 RepID=A0ABW5G334_9PSEU